MDNYVLIITMHADPAMPPGYGEWGGTHTYMRELLDSLGDLDVNCVLITRRAMKELPEVEQYSSNCTIYRLHNGSIAPMNKTLLYKYHDDNLAAIKQIINKYGSLPQIIHSVYWNSGRLGMELSKLYKIPLVHSVISNSYGRQARGAFEPVLKRAEYEQLIYDYAKWILCVSDDEKNDLIRFYNIDSKKIIVAGQYIHPSFILPARDINGFPRLNSNILPEAQYSAAIRYNDAFRTKTTDEFWNHKAFTYFGRIDESKGVDHVLSAWCYLYQKHGALCPPLWLIGGSIAEINKIRTKNKHFTSQLIKAEYEGKIIWWGCLDPIGASTLLLKTLVLVTNSLYEPGGRVITEAMSEGVPVIAAPNGFALDLVRNWYNGFLVAHGDENELSKRMEHFIRQPFLSNTLGENARQTAKNVINEWDFIGKHIMSYGIDLPKTRHIHVDCLDYFSCRKITLFPYGSLPLSSKLLCDFLDNSTEDHAISEPEICDVNATSDIYRIMGTHANYIIKHPFTRLSLGAMVVPVRKHQYVRNASDVYRYEVAAYESANSDILVAKDDFHQLLLFRELDTFSPSYDEYPQIIQFLSTQYIPLSDKVAIEYNNILNSTTLVTLDDIEQLLERLSELFPDFYFESSGTFSPHIGWKIAPHLLEYNISYFEKEHVVFLQTVCAHFAEAVNLDSIQFWYEINSDVSLKHILLDSGKMQIIDREKRTIGIPEYVIADFLLDILLRELPNSSNVWVDLLNNKVPITCNRRQIIESLSYKLFYSIIIEGTLQKSPIEPYMDALEVLLSASKEL